ncbi:MAG: polysulfide reductase NrfD [Anaerolineae bacterium]|nr:polysulfide reductase NrfD [Anaerolineae bacterium]
MVAKVINDVKQNRGFYIWMAFLLAVFGVAGVAAILVWTRGLEVTGLSNEVPWGLWITVDLSAVALGSGSFAVAGLVYLFGAKRFAAVSRVALLIGFLADTGTALVLLLDLGRPDNFYHPIIYWNTKSLLWVITWSVILYITILLIELAPVLTESKLFARWPIVHRIGEEIHKATPVAAFMGVVISIIHLSATGATYGILRGRPVWFDPAMPVIFLVSGIFAGISFLIMVIVVTSWVMRRRLVDPNLLDQLARIAGWVGVTCGIIRVIDLSANHYFSYKPFLGESINLLYNMTPYSLALTLGEFAFGLIIPLAIFFNPTVRVRFRNLVLAGVGATTGLLLCRWNVTLTGLVATVSYSPSAPSINFFSYFPTWVEWAAVAGVLAYAGMVYTLAVRFLPIFGAEGEEEETELAAERHHAPVVAA